MQARHSDRFISNYVLDLLAPDSIYRLLLEAYRLLIPGGKLCMVSVTLGQSHIPRAVCWSWQHLWQLSPGIVGGRHPIELMDYLFPNLWNPDHQSKLTSWGITSEVVVASAK
jgi:hypothetical protein